MAFLIKTGCSGTIKARYAPGKAILVARLGKQNTYFWYENNIAMVWHWSSTWTVQLNMPPSPTRGLTGSWLVTRL